MLLAPPSLAPVCEDCPNTPPVPRTASPASPAAADATGIFPPTGASTTPRGSIGIPAEGVPQLAPAAAHSAVAEVFESNAALPSSPPAHQQQKPYDQATSEHVCGDSEVRRTASLLCLCADGRVGSDDDLPSSSRPLPFPEPLTLPEPSRGRRGRNTDSYSKEG